MWFENGALKANLPTHMTSEVMEKIINNCFELVEQGKITYMEFYNMKLKDMCEILDKARTNIE